MNVAVIGLGSMGRRRIRLMLKINPLLTILGIDSNQKRCEDAEKEFGIMCLQSMDDLFKAYTVDCAFVCTSPLSHAQIILKLLDYGVNIFTEINLVDDCYDEIISKSNRIGKVLFLSSTFLYRKDIQCIIEKTKEKRVNYIYHTGQYLPDWHPWEKYQNFFVADVRTNGCREIMAIEFPWIVKCFGEIKKVNVMKDKLSNLQLDYCDNYMIMIEHENGNKGQIAIDVVARKAKRELEIYNEELQIFWSGTPDSLLEYDIEEKATKKVVTYASVERDSNYCDNIIENAYADEIQTFFALVNQEKDLRALHDFESDKRILEVINRIEEEK